MYFDNVGGEILDAVLKRLRLHARIVLCGGISQYNATGETRGPSNYLSLISARGRMEGFVIIDYLDRAAEAVAAMAPWVQAGKLKSRIDVVDGLEHFPEALRRVYTGANFGKQLVKRAERPPALPYPAEGASTRDRALIARRARSHRAALSQERALRAHRAPVATDAPDR